MNSVPMPVAVRRRPLRPKFQSSASLPALLLATTLPGKSEAGVQHQAVENGAAEGNRCAGAADRGGDRAGVDQRAAEVEGDAQHGTRNDETRGGVDTRAGIDHVHANAMAAGGRDEAFVEHGSRACHEHAIDNPGDRTVATVGQVAACVEEHADPAGAQVSAMAPLLITVPAVASANDAVAAGDGSGDCVGDGAAARHHHARALGAVPDEMAVQWSTCRRRRRRPGETALRPVIYCRRLRW